MIVCPHCQSQNPDRSAYCTGCGQMLGTAPAAYGRAREPEKKGLAVAALVLGILSLPLMACFGLGVVLALVGGILAVVALVKASREPHLYGGKGLAIGGLVSSGFSLLLVPIVAAIAIPSLLKARSSANEAAVIGDVRSVISAQASYASQNSGYYDTLECLATPSNCIPGYSGPTFLDPALARAEVKGGYRRSFYAGPPGDPTMAMAPISPSSVSSFAYAAVPETPGQTGVRSFCGDESGRVCATGSGQSPVENGRCSEACRSLY